MLLNRKASAQARERKTEEKKEAVERTEELSRKMKGPRKEGGEEAVMRVERKPEKTKGGKTEEKKTAVGRKEELPRKMTGPIKEGRNKAVKRAERIPMKMKGRKTEEKKENRRGEGSSGEIEDREVSVPSA